MDTAQHQKPFVIPIFIPHAGCPHRCVFCDQTSTTGECEALPADQQLQEVVHRYLSYRKDSGRYTEISFYGGNFLGLPRATVRNLLALADQYVSKGDVQGIRFSTRPDTIDQQKLSLIREFSVTTIELGVQTMNDHLLEISRRGHTVEHIRNAVKRLRQHPYRLGLQMMVGLPGEDITSALATAARLSLLAPDFVRIYPTVVLKGSPLERWYREGRYNPLALDEAVQRVKALYILFCRYGIKVVRMGLQPTEELNTGAAVVAGPFHPAFGELVHAALWRDALERTLRRMALTGRMPVIELHPKLLSRVKGHKNSNVEYFVKTRALSGIEFRAVDNLPMDTIMINGKLCRAMEI